VNAYGSPVFTAGPAFPNHSYAGRPSLLFLSGRGMVAIVSGHLNMAWIITAEICGNSDNNQQKIKKLMTAINI
jgi:hypothetical protein